MANPADAPKERHKPGPKADVRLSVTFRVEQPIYDQLAELQSLTGQTPDQVAGLLLHLLVADPANATVRLRALLGIRESDPASRPTLVPDKGAVG